MTALNTIKLSYRPTARQQEAIEALTVDLSVKETYTGKWLKSDTVRYLLKTPYVPNNYPSNGIARSTLKSVTLSKEQYEAILVSSPKLEGESNLAYTERLITSALIQHGYLKSERLPRKCEIQNQDISA